MCWMRASVFCVPSSDRNASRSRSRKCCSLTTPGARSPPQRMVATLVADERVVLADLAAAQRVVDARLEGGERGPAQRRTSVRGPARRGSRRAPGRAPPAWRRAIRRSGFGESESAGACRTCAAPRRPRSRPWRRRSGRRRASGTGTGRRPRRPAQRSCARSAISLVPPPPGIRPTPDLDEAHVGLGRGADARAVQR